MKYVSAPSLMSAALAWIEAPNFDRLSDLVLRERLVLEGHFPHGHDIKLSLSFSEGAQFVVAETGGKIVRILARPARPKTAPVRSDTSAEVFAGAGTRGPEVFNPRTGKMFSRKEVD